jgi:asparagine N-glycosylation enzyme membrane subunit Stt3
MEFTALALAVMAAFTGAACYLYFVEHPARRDMLDGDMLAQWQRSCPRAIRVLAPLALAGFFFGLLALFWSGGALNLTGALFAASIGVVTYKWITPLDKTLMTTPTETADAATRALMEKWNLLHGLLACLGFLAVLCFFAAIR